eukprot:1280563-Rhodomonas_salina.1
MKDSPVPVRCAVPRVRTQGDCREGRAGRRGDLHSSDCGLIASSRQDALHVLVDRQHLRHAQ